MIRTRSIQHYRQWNPSRLILCTIKDQLQRASTTGSSTRSCYYCCYTSTLLKTTSAATTSRRQQQPILIQRLQQNHHQQQQQNHHQQQQQGFEKRHNDYTYIHSDHLKLSYSTSTPLSLSSSNNKKKSTKNDTTKNYTTTKETNDTFFEILTGLQKVTTNGIKGSIEIMKLLSNTIEYNFQKTNLLSKNTKLKITIVLLESKMYMKSFYITILQRRNKFIQQHESTIKKSIQETKNLQKSIVSSTSKLDQVSNNFTSKKSKFLATTYQTVSKIANLSETYMTRQIINKNKNSTAEKSNTKKTSNFSSLLDSTKKKFNTYIQSITKTTVFQNSILINNTLGKLFRKYMNQFYWWLLSAIVLYGIAKTIITKIMDNYYNDNTTGSTSTANSYTNSTNSYITSVVDDNNNNNKHNN